MKSGRSPPHDSGARSRGLLDEHSVTSGTQTTGSFFSDDEEVDSAIGLVVDTCNAAIQDMGNGKAHSFPQALDKHHSCTERPRYPNSSSMQRVLSVGRPGPKHTEHGGTNHQAVHSMLLPHT